MIRFQQKEQIDQVLALQTDLLEVQEEQEEVHIWEEALHGLDLQGDLMGSYEMKYKLLII